MTRMISTSRGKKRSGSTDRVRKLVAPQLSRGWKYHLFARVRGVAWFFADLRAEQVQVTM